MMRRRRGQALIEAAIAALALLFLILGTLDFTGAYWRCQAMQHAAEIGAEWAALRGVGSPASEIGPGDESFVRHVVNAAASGFKPTDITVTTEWLDGDNQPGNRVKVTASYPLPLTVTRRFFPGGCAPVPACEGSAVRMILRH